MRLVIYTHRFAPQVGGVETAVMTLAEGLAQTGEDDDPGAIAGRETGGGEPRSAERGKRIEVTVVTPAPAGEMDDRALAFRVVRQPSLLKLFRLLREADLIHLAGPTLVPLGFCALLRKPVVIEHHGFQAVCPNGQLFYEPTQTPCPGHFMGGRHRECLRCNAGQGLLGSLKMWALTFPRRWLCRRAAANVVPTQWLGSLLQLPRVPVIHHGLSVVGAGPSGRQAGPTTFAFLGRLVSTKGADVFLRAASRLKSQGFSFRAEVIGEGPCRAALEALAQECGLEGVVRFRGYVPAAALRDALSATQAIVVPSLAGEVFGLVALEGMLRGKTVLISDIGALAEVVGDAGLKFRPGDVNGLCACLRRVLEHPEIVEEYGAKARERAQKLFRCERMVEEHRQLYRELADEP